MGPEGGREEEIISSFASLSFQCLSSRTDLPVVKHWTSCYRLKINNIPVVPLEATRGPVLFNVSLAL